MGYKPTAVSAIAIRQVRSAVLSYVGGLVGDNDTAVSAIAIRRVRSAVLILDVGGLVG